MSRPFAKEGAASSRVTRKDRGPRTKIALSNFLKKALFTGLFLGLLGGGVSIVGLDIETTKQSTQALQEIRTVRDAVHRLLENEYGYDSLDDKMLASSQLLPLQMIDDDGGIRNMFGGHVHVAPAAMEGGFYLGYDNVPSALCRKMAATEFDSETLALTVSSTNAVANAIGASHDKTNLTLSCGDNVATLAWEFR